MPLASLLHAGTCTIPMQHVSILQANCRSIDEEGEVFVYARMPSISNCVTCSQLELSNTAPSSQVGAPLRKAGGQGDLVMYVQVQHGDTAAVDYGLPAFTHTGSCTVVQGIALQLKGNCEKLKRDCSPI